MSAARKGAREAGHTPPQRYGQFGRLLKRAREREGLTQEQLAQRIGQTQEYMSHLEGGRSLPSLETALDLAGVLHTTVDALVGRGVGLSGSYPTHAEVIYVQHLHGNCVLGGLDLALDPEGVRALVEFFRGQAEAFFAERRRRDKGDGAA